uniref:Amyloid beta A4 precursor protein-binding family B member 1-interacting protein n=1 Tax=Paramormyrops kingsleyae TaxID=1676925 RepID=A0A3B3SDF2_9TELE
MFCVKDFDVSNSLPNFSQIQLNFLCRVWCEKAFTRLEKLKNDADSAEQYKTVLNNAKPGLWVFTDASNWKSCALKSLIHYSFNPVLDTLPASLNELEDNDLDALMADLVAEINAVEESVAQAKSAGGAPKPPPPKTQDHAAPHPAVQNNLGPSIPAFAPSPDLTTLSPALKPQLPEDAEAQAKADKIKQALEKLKEAKVKKLVTKVTMSDESSKTLMVDERQMVRDVLDNLFEKTHCNCSVDWTLIETNPELNTERGFEDHEHLVETLSAWTRDSENKIYFLEKVDKYAVFKNPQNFYLWKKDKKALQDVKDKDKELLLKENFCGTSIIVPDLEGVLYLKEDGKKSWKQRYFLLRASGIYYVPKGKTKTSRDLACFVQFDNVNIYYGKEYKNKYKAPTDFCFVLKHPQIQKESQYIKYLCCDDAWTMTLWVTGIRIAKYGVKLYDNYKAAVSKATTSSLFANRAAPSTSTSSAAPAGKILPPPNILSTPCFNIITLLRSMDGYSCSKRAILSSLSLLIQLRPRLRPTDTQGRPPSPRRSLKPGPRLRIRITVTCLPCHCHLRTPPYHRHRPHRLCPRKTNLPYSRSPETSPHRHHQPWTFRPHLQTTCLSCPPTSCHRLLRPLVNRNPILSHPLRHPLPHPHPHPQWCQIQLLHQRR